MLTARRVVSRPPRCLAIFHPELVRVDDNDDWPIARWRVRVHPARPACAVTGLSTSGEVGVGYLDPVVLLDPDSGRRGVLIDTMLDGSYYESDRDELFGRGLYRGDEDPRAEVMYRENRVPRPAEVPGEDAVGRRVRWIIAAGHKTRTRDPETELAANLYICPRCGGNRHIIDVELRYSNDIFSHHTYTWLLQRGPDFFLDVSLYAACAACAEVKIVMEYQFD